MAATPLASAVVYLAHPQVVPRAQRVQWLFSCLQRPFPPVQTEGEVG
jgi:hypothetical protein